MSTMTKSCLVAVLLTSQSYAQQSDGSGNSPTGISLSPVAQNPFRQAEPVRVAQASDLLSGAANPLYGIRASNKVLDGAALAPNAIAVNGRGVFWRDSDDDADGEPGEADSLNLFHQPLIQIKVRIIEVVREDNLAAKTVLDFVRDRGPDFDSLINQHTVNNGRRGGTASTRFENELLPNVNLSGSGAIINVTKEHINLVGEFLATEFKADLVTCPQVVTLNGQKVELISGVNTPFQLGQSVLRDGTLAVQETFYKHVGTSLTVVPRIINWGPRGEGRGRRPVMTLDVLDWNGVAAFLLSHSLVDSEDRTSLSKYAGNNVLMPIADQQLLLNAVNQFDRSEITALLSAKEQAELFRPLDCVPCQSNGCPCDWDPSDCTLDVEIVLRQSTPAKSATLDLTGDTRTNIDLTSEEIGAAIATVVQLKNGRGAVLAGLIGERDLKVTSKVPLIGDIPIVGAAFRSRATNRQKTEIVIFLEAEILKSDPKNGLAQAAHDFDLTRSYLNEDVLCNPLEAGLQRAGIGSYLPPRSSDERVYWMRHGRKVQKTSTGIDDIFR